MDISLLAPYVFDAEGDVNVKNAYVNCQEFAPPPRALLEMPSVPPLVPDDE